MRKKRSQNNNSSGGSWMDTYGDLVTLLLCFFVLLFSFSTIDAAKWEALVKSFSGSTGVISENSPNMTQPLNQSQIIRPSENVWDQHGQTSSEPPEERPETIPPQPSPTAVATPMPTPTSVPTVTPKATTQAAETTKTTTTAQTTTKTQGTTKAPEPTPTPEPVLDAFYSELYNYFNDRSLAEAVQINYNGSQITVRLIASVIFEPGSDRLVPEAESILSGAAIIIDEYMDEIAAMRIEGHTDNRFEDEDAANDAFELAAARAVRVNRFMLNHSDIAEYKASVSGHGSNQPVADNETTEGRNQNNRVDIVLNS